MSLGSRSSNGTLTPYLENHIINHFPNIPSHERISHCIASLSSELRVLLVDVLLMIFFPWLKAHFFCVFHFHMAFDFKPFLTSTMGGADFTHNCHLVGEVNLLRMLYFSLLLKCQTLTFGLLFFSQSGCDGCRVGQQFQGEPQKYHFDCLWLYLLLELSLT